MIDAPYAADRLKITEELFVEIRTDLLPEFEDYINDLEGRIHNFHDFYYEEPTKENISKLIRLHKEVFEFAGIT